jgi:hypothetical protein
MKHILTILFTLLTLTGFGQSTTIDLAVQYGVNFQNGNKTLTEQFGTVTAAKAKLKDLFGWANTKGWTDAEIMALPFMEAGWINAFWMGENGNYASPAPSHAWNIHVPNGGYNITYPLPFASGIYSGEGARFHDGTNAHSYGSTELRIDHANWKTSRSADRMIMRSANWGSEGGYGAWVHDYKIMDFCFNGKKRFDYTPSGPEESAGIGVWDAGESSIITHCYAFDFEKDGYLFVRGTPAKIEYSSAFTTNRFGYASVGRGNLTIIGPSGDENRMGLIGLIGGYDRPGGGCLTVLGNKFEGSTSGEFRPWNGAPFIYAEGWSTITITGVTFASTNVYPYCFIRIRPDVNRSTISVRGLEFFGAAPQVLVYDEHNDKEYRMIGDAWNTPVHSWEWDQTLGLVTPWQTVTPVTRSGPKGRLQHVGPDGATSWATAGVFDPYGGVVAPPNPCTYTYTTYGPCVNGTQTRTVLTALPTGCTGTPSLSQPCGVTPTPCTYTKTGTGPCVNGQSLDTYSASPTGCTGTAPVTYTTCTTGAVKASYNFSAVNPATITAQVGVTMKQTDGAKRVSSMSGGKITNTNGNANYPVSWNGATSITVTGFVASAMNYQLICGKIDTDGFGRGIMLLPNGSVIDNTLSGGDRVLLPAGTVKIGTAVTFTATFSAMDVQFFGGTTGNAWQGVMDQFEVR